MMDPREFCNETVDAYRQVCPFVAQALTMAPNPDHSVDDCLSAIAAIPDDEDRARIKRTLEAAHEKLEALLARMA